MPSMVPVHTIHVSRPHPSGRKDKEGNPIHQRITPKIGEPFDFTDEEMEDIQNSSPFAVRDPVNEGGEVKDADAADKAALDAAQVAREKGSAIGDAFVTAQQGAKGRGARRQPDNQHAGEAPGPEAGEEDEL